MPASDNDKECDFNPRSPHGERRKYNERHAIDFTISIHAPRTGSDA